MIYVILTTYSPMPFLWCSNFLSESAIWTPNTVGVNGSAGLHKTGLCFHYSPSSPPHTIRLFRHTLIVLHCVTGQTQSQEERERSLLTNGCLLSRERQKLKQNRKKKQKVETLACHHDVLVSNPGWDILVCLKLECFLGWVPCGSIFIIIY